MSIKIAAVSLIHPINFIINQSPWEWDLPKPVEDCPANPSTQGQRYLQIQLIQLPSNIYSASC